MSNDLYAMRLTLVAAASALALTAGPAMALISNSSSPATVAATQDADSFSDQELRQFGTAMDGLRTISAQIQNGTPTPEQQAEMAAVVEGSGLSIDRFNAIGQAVSQDPVLQARMQVVMAPPLPAGSVAASVTDEEVAQFSAVMGSLRTISAQIQNGTPTPEQQAEMAAVVEGSGLSIDRFNAISQAVSEDEALRARVELADARRAAGG